MSRNICFLAKMLVLSLFVVFILITPVRADIRHYRCSSGEIFVDLDKHLVSSGRSGGYVPYTVDGNKITWNRGTEYFYMNIEDGEYWNDIQHGQPGCKRTDSPSTIQAEINAQRASENARISQMERRKQQRIARSPTYVGDTDNLVLRRQTNAFGSKISITSKVSNITVNAIVVNRGVCRLNDGRENDFPFSLSFSETVSFVPINRDNDFPCSNVIEISLYTNEGVLTYSFD